MFVGLNSGIWAVFGPVFFLQNKGNSGKVIL